MTSVGYFLSKLPEIEEKYQNEELEAGEIPKEKFNHDDEDEKIIRKMKKEVKILQQDFTNTFPMICQIINQILDSRLMKNYAEAMEWLIELDTRISLNHLKLKVETEKQR